MSTSVSLYAIDVSKAFDRVNHHALFSKLMKRHVPNAPVTVLERWLSSCCSCVKWYDVWSDFFTLSYGVRQGSVFRHFSLLCTWMILPKCSPVLYADDILLIARPFCL